MLKFLIDKLVVVENNEYAIWMGHTLYSQQQEICQIKILSPDPPTSCPNSESLYKLSAGARCATVHVTSVLNHVTPWSGRS